MYAKCDDTIYLRFEDFRSTTSLTYMSTLQETGSNKSLGLGRLKDKVRKLELRMSGRTGSKMTFDKSGVKHFLSSLAVPSSGYRFQLFLFVSLRKNKPKIHNTSTGNRFNLLSNCKVGDLRGFRNGFDSFWPYRDFQKSYQPCELGDMDSDEVRQ